MQDTDTSKHHRPAPPAARAVCVCLLLSLLGGCKYLPTLDKVKNDEREEYTKHREMEDLEIPPDLTRELPSEPPLVVNDPPPGDGLPREQAKTQPAATPGTPLPAPSAATNAVLASRESGGVLLQITAGLEETWPRLRAYWTKVGRELSIDDMELGVMETSWSTPHQEGARQTRDKITLIVEAREGGSRLMLHISHARERLQEDPNGAQAWLPVQSEPGRDQQLAARLTEHLGAAGSTES